MNENNITITPQVFKITLSKENQKISVIESTRPSITLSRVGTQGPPGNGIPEGGTFGQILQRTEDGSVGWGANLEDINTDYVYEAIGVSSILDIEHSKNKRVTVTYINRQEEQEDIAYCQIDDNNVRVSAINPLNGFIIIK